MKKIYLLIILFITLYSLVDAQDIVSGTITHEETGNAIQGASIVVKGTTIGAYSDENGRYQISLPDNADILVFYYVNKLTQEVSIGGRSQIDISLADDLLELEEVIITANAIERQKKELGYAVSVVSSDEITKARTPNVVDALAGKVPGVRITSQSGTLGGSSKILIRGANSLITDGSGASNQPIFVVDGLPISNSGFNGSRSDIINGGVDVGNRAQDINPDDIASITVLKGAAATALYGARAKDGAIIITTKRGARGKGGTISFSSSIRFDDVLKLPDFQNEYASGDFGEYDIGAFQNGWGPRISEVQGQLFEDFKNDSVQLRAFPDNVRDFYETGMTYINSVSFSGGSEEGDFRMGYTNLHQTGTVPNTELNRHTIAFNSGRDVGKHFFARISGNYVRTTSEGRPIQGGNDPNAIANLVNGMPRTTDLEALRNNILDPNGNPYGTDSDANGSRSSNNPFWVTQNNGLDNQVDRLFGSSELTYRPLSWMEVTGRVGVDIFTENRVRIVRKGTLNQVDGQFDTREIFSNQFNSDLLLTIRRDISPDLNIQFIAGHNVFSQRTRRSRVISSSLNADELYTFANANTNVPTNTLIQRRLIGVYGDLTLGYKDWFFLNATGRNDWNSTLPVDNNSYFYPSVSASLVFTDAFGIESNWLSYGKIRANFANVGSAVEPYSLDFTFIPQDDLFTQFVANNIYPHGGQSAFAATDVLPEANLLAQNQEQFEVGAELVFFEGRIRLDAAYYNTTTDDQILNLDIAQSTGFDARVINAGSVSNKGIETYLELAPFRSPNRQPGDFDLEIGLNFTRNKNEVESLASGLDFINLTSGFSGLIIRGLPGEPFSMFGAGWERDPATGLPVINPNTGLRELGNAVNLGSIYPDWTLGINNTLSFKNFSLSFLVDIREGGVVFSNTTQGLRINGLAEETLANRGQVFIDEGVIENEDGTFRPNDVPVQSMQQFWENYSSNSAIESSVFDASYVKLREVRFGYTFPSELLQGTPISNLNIAFEGRNLWIIHDEVPHIDPETNFFGTSLTGEGVEFNSIPSTRSLGFNLRMSF